VIAALARHVHSRLSRHNDHHFGAVLREYDRHHALVGRPITVMRDAPSRARGHGRTSDRSQTLAGVCVGLDAAGRLLLRDGKAMLHRVVAGHVVLAPPAVR